MNGYLTIKHPITGELIKVVPTGKVKDNQAEVVCITPKANLDRLWITHQDLNTNLV